MENTMEPTPETSLLAQLSEHWTSIAAAIAGAGTTWGVYRRYVRGKWKAVRVWAQQAVAAPSLITKMQAEMVLRDEFVVLKTDIHSIRTDIIRETASRRALLQHSDKALFEADKAGRYLWVNAAYLSLVDRELHEVKDANWRNSIHDIDRAAAVEAWRSAVQDATDYRFKFRVVTNEREFWVWAEAVCNRDELGNVLSFVGEFRIIEDPRGSH